MKKNKPEVVEDQDLVDKRGLEIVKAVAQAWYSHSECSRPTNEFDARKRNFRGNPTRFKLEAKRDKLRLSSRKSGFANPSWDFGQSLWDSYEIVAVSKRLETGLVLDSSFSETSDGSTRVHKPRKESKNSLRSLFSQMSSRRFDEAKIPRDSDL